MNEPNRKDQNLELFLTCPSFTGGSKGNYIEEIRKASRLGEAYGYNGIVIDTYTNHIDPWAISQIIIESTHKLSPIVAVNPKLMHPYSVAKRVLTIGELYNRKLHLNIVGKGFKKDMDSLDEESEDNGDEIANEFIQLFQQLLNSDKPVSFDGDFYSVHNLSLESSIREDLMPAIFVSDSPGMGPKEKNQPGATAARISTNATQKYTDSQPSHRGIRVGIIAREETATAWEVGFDRFPEQRKGQLAQKQEIASSNWADSDTRFRIDNMNTDDPSPCWLHPREKYDTSCPYLVGSYIKVAEEIRRYVELGISTFVVDIPKNKEELLHTNRVFNEVYMEAVA